MDFDFPVQPGKPRKCQHCKRELSSRLPRSVKMHSYCAKNYSTAELENLFQSEPVETPEGSPISPVEVPMKSATAKISKLPVTTESVLQAAEEYKAFHLELERICLAMEKMKDFFRENLPPEGVPVGDEILYPCSTVSEKFDLEAAEETLAQKELKKLEPYIKVSRSLDLKAAANLIDMTKFKKFIQKKESVQIRFKKAKGE